MNILMVADNFFPEIIGGSGRVVSEISKRLVKKGHSVYVLTRASPKSNDGTINGVKVHHFNIRQNNDAAYLFSSIVNSLRQFTRLASKINFDIINFHQPLSALSVSLSKPAKNIPKIYTFHSSWPREYEVRRKKRGLGFFARKYIERLVLDRSQQVLVLSEFSKQEIVSVHKLGNKNIEVIHGGVDTGRFKPCKDKELLLDKLNIPPDKFLLFTVRNLVPRMGLENLIDAIAIVVKKMPNIMLVIAGEGFLKPQLKSKVSSLNLNNHIKFAGFIDDDMLPLYYQASDIFVLPTRELEGFGLVTLEALSCGLPVLGTPVGGTKEILGKLDQDLLFKGIDAVSMAEKILLFLSSKDLALLGQACRDFVVANYSWDRMSLEYENIYLKCLK